MIRIKDWWPVGSCCLTTQFYEGKKLKWLHNQWCLSWTRTAEAVKANWKCVCTKLPIKW